MNTAPNPEMVTLAREIRGLTQKELAEITNIGQGSLSRFEIALSPIPDRELKLLADALDFPVSFFYREGRRRGAETGELFHRKKQSLSSKKLKQLDGILNLFRLNMKILLDPIEVEYPLTIPYYDIRNFNGSISDIAESVRALWKIPSGPIFNLIEVMEDAFCSIFTCDFSTDEMDEIVQWVEPMPPVMLVNSKAPGDRLRFSIAHALGHLVMHRNIEPYPEMEKEAHQFAAAFLMPAADIIDDYDEISIERMIQLKSKWKTSIQSLIYRGNELGKISDRRKTTLFEFLSRNKYRKQEPFPIPPEQPKLFKILWNKYQEELNYNNHDLAQMLKVNEHDIQMWYFPEKLHTRFKGNIIKFDDDTQFG